MHFGLAVSAASAPRTPRRGKLRNVPTAHTGISNEAGRLTVISL